MSPSLAIALEVLAVLSLATFLLFAWDKRCARRGRRRVPERTLLLLAGLGGWPGAYAAMPVLRHKTQKRPFRRRIHVLAASWCLIVAIVVWLT